MEGGGFACNFILLNFQLTFTLIISQFLFHNFLSSLSVDNSKQWRIQDGAFGANAPPPPPLPLPCGVAIVSYNFD